MGIHAHSMAGKKLPVLRLTARDRKGMNQGLSGHRRLRGSKPSGLRIDDIRRCHIERHLIGVTDDGDGLILCETFFQLLPDLLVVSADHSQLALLPVPFPDFPGQFFQVSGSHAASDEEMKLLFR